MVAKHINSTPLQYILMSLFLLGTLGSIFLPDVVPFKWGANYAVHLMYSFLGLGLLSLAVRQTKLLFTSFLCSALLCFFLKNASSEDIIYPKSTGAPSVNIAQINISASNNTPEETLQRILDTEADILSIQEVTPDWGTILHENLSAQYPYSSTVYRPEDFMGIGVYSKLPFEQLDTFYYNDVPNLAMTIMGDNQHDKVHFVFSYIYPSLLDGDAARSEGHLDLIGSYVSKLNAPVLVLGEYNQLQWSPIVRSFRAKHQLQDSRRYPLSSYPSDHIFYSSHFNCTDFRAIHTDLTPHLGIFGNFELTKDQLYAQKAARKF